MISQLLLDIETAIHSQRVSEIKASARDYDEYKNDEFLYKFTRICSVNYGYLIDIQPTDDGLYKLFISVDNAPDSETIFKIIASSEYAEKIKSIRFAHKGGQANGTVELYFAELLSYNSFPNLSFFYTQHFSKDGALIASMNGGYDEDGLGGKILDMMPEVKILNLVSAPNDDFFKRDYHPIETLEVRAGYDNNMFLERLTECKSFPNLKYFSYQDINLAFTQSPEEYVMPFEVIEKFMESKNFPKLETLSLLELKITEDQIQKLKKTYLGQKVKKLVLANQRNIDIETSQEYRMQRDWFIQEYFSF